ncbi:hypothetical protein D3C71_1575280 [compost metagenome]
MRRLRERTPGPPGQPLPATGTGRGGATATPGSRPCRAHRCRGDRTTAIKTARRAIRPGPAPCRRAARSGFPQAATPGIRFRPARRSAARPTLRRAGRPASASIGPAGAHAGCQGAPPRAGRSHHPNTPRPSRAFRPRASRAPPRARRPARRIRARIRLAPRRRGCRLPAPAGDCPRALARSRPRGRAWTTATIVSIVVAEGSASNAGQVAVLKLDGS